MPPTPTSPAVTPPMPTKRPVPVLKNMPTNPAPETLQNDAFLISTPRLSAEKRPRTVRAWPLDIVLYLFAAAVAAHSGGLQFKLPWTAAWKAAELGLASCSLNAWLTWYAALGLGHRVFRLLADQ